uniref:Uncharacterized protein n=1 Tax=Cucumis melo TaxID=3656 RepID=A0A9I9EG73_CUCME
MAHTSIAALHSTHQIRNQTKSMGESVGFFTSIGEKELKRKKDLKKALKLQVKVDDLKSWRETGRVHDMSYGNSVLALCLC